MRIACPGWKAGELPHVEVQTQMLVLTQKFFD